MPVADAAAVRTEIVSAITTVAPDIATEIETLGDDVDVFEEFGLDSMDRMNIMTALVASTGVDIPDDLYARLNTIAQLIGQLS